MICQVPAWHSVRRGHNPFAQRQHTAAHLPRQRPPRHQGKHERDGKEALHRVPGRGIVVASASHKGINGKTIRMSIKRWVTLSKRPPIKPERMPSRVELPGSASHPASRRSAKPGRHRRRAKTCHDHSGRCPSRISLPARQRGTSGCPLGSNRRAGRVRRRRRNAADNACLVNWQVGAPKGLGIDFGLGCIDKGRPGKISPFVHDARQLGGRRRVLGMGGAGS